jgi:hypothetical protein
VPRGLWLLVAGGLMVAGVGSGGWSLYYVVRALEAVLR